MKPPTHRASILVLLVLTTVLSVFFQSFEVRPHTPQSVANRTFADRSTLAEAIQKHPRYWPPLYPALLRVLKTFHAPYVVLNYVLIFLISAWVYDFTRRHIGHVTPIGPATLFATCGAAYVTASLLYSEPLMVLCCCLSLSFLLSYVRTSRRVYLAALSVAAAAACLSRLFAIFWLMPIIAAYLLVMSRGSVGRGVLRAAAVTIPAMVPIGLWMGYAYRTTGFLSGLERFDGRTQDTTTFVTNVRDMLTTLHLDLISVRSSWALRPAVREFEITVGELVPMVAFCGVLGVVLVSVAMECARERLTWERVRSLALNRQHDAGVLLVQFVSWFAVVLAVLWTIGNNDRISCRFMFPVYVFGLLLGTWVYSVMKRRRTRNGKVARVGCWALGGWVLLAQLVKMGRLVGS